MEELSSNSEPGSNRPTGPQGARQRQADFPFIVDRRTRAKCGHGGMEARPGWE